MIEMIFIWSAFIIGAILYQRYMYRTTDAAEATVNYEFEKLRYQEYLNEYLNSSLSNVRSWMNGQPIDAITSMVPSERIRPRRFYFYVRVAGKFKVSQEPRFYIILSGDDVHCISTDEYLDLDEHLVFGPDELKDSTLGPPKLIKPRIRQRNRERAKRNERYLPYGRELSLPYEDRRLDLLVFDRLNFDPRKYKILDGTANTQMRVKDKVIGSRFLEMLIEKYPNLSSAEDAYVLVSGEKFPS